MDPDPSIHVALEKNGEHQEWLIARMRRGPWSIASYADGIPTLKLAMNQLDAVHARERFDAQIRRSMDDGWIPTATRLTVPWPV